MYCRMIDEELNERECQECAFYIPAHFEDVIVFGNEHDTIEITSECTYSKLTPIEKGKEEKNENIFKYFKVFGSFSCISDWNCFISVRIKMA